MYRWDVAEAARLIEDEQATMFIGPSAMTGDLVNHARAVGKDLSSLNVVGGGGAARAPEQVRGISKSFAKAHPNTGWGMTETNAIGCGVTGPAYLRKPASSGQCSAVLEMRIVDDEGKALPFGQRGELQVSGTSIFYGYWNRPDANAETFDGDWLKTGDVAYIDDDGFVFIVDRIKDMVIRGAERTSAAGRSRPPCSNIRRSSRRRSTLCPTSALARKWARRSTPLRLLTSPNSMVFWPRGLPVSRCRVSCIRRRRRFRVLRPARS